MRRSLAPIVVSVIAIVVLVAVLASMWKADVPTVGSGAPLVLYCAAGIKNPVAEVARMYEEEYDVSVQIQYGGSGTLLSNLRVTDSGDLYLAADNTYIDLAREKGLLDEAIPLSHMAPVIAVPKGNPKKIVRVDDLLRDGVRVSLGLPSAASIGRHTELVLKQIRMWKRLEQAVQARGVSRPTVNEVANDVKIGSADAGIVWNATVNQYPELTAVPIPGADKFPAAVVIGVLRSSKQPTAALRFARYLGARDKGLPVFERMGWPPVDGDVWAETPEIKYYAGGVNRLAIQETVRAFEKREGVRITTVFNGCGILTGQIKLGDRPDCYHTCDMTFMKGVEDAFGDAVKVTENDMVIAVAKGNPKGIKGLGDLTQKGLRIGVTNPKQSALGALTVRLLKKAGLLAGVTRNVVARTPTADLLVNQIRTGSLDAVVVYRANVVAVLEHLDVVPIDRPDAKAVQSFAIGKGTKHRYLMHRLFDALRSAESKERFRQGGFRWIEKAEGS